jgi:hypothetical protein
MWHVVVWFVGYPVCSSFVEKCNCKLHYFWITQYSVSTLSGQHLQLLLRQPIVMLVDELTDKHV